MTHRVSRLAVALLSLSLASAALPLQAQFPSLPKLPGASVNASASASTSGSLGAGLTDGQIGGGLKDALSVGTQKAVKVVSSPGGYLDNAAIKILLPKNLQPVEKVLRGAGQGAKIDTFVDSMNHAAESAAPEAASIFGDAVKAMSIDDARKLLNGGDTSITEYFKSKTSAQLTAAFRPHVEAAMKTNGVTTQFQALQSSAPKLPFGVGASAGGGFDINTYVVNGALSGLFYMLGQQEKEIRTNPAARTTGLLKSVFGK